MRHPNAGKVTPVDEKNKRRLTDDPTNSKLLILTAPEALAVLDNDCACPDTPFRITSAISSDTNFVQTPGCVTSDLPGNFTMVFSPLAPAGPAVLSLEARRHWETFRLPQSKLHTIDDQLLGQGLIQPEVMSTSVSATAPSTLTTWLHVSNACNLDCPYCYVRKSSAYMKDEIIKPVIDKIVQSALNNNFRSVKLKYAGGEASLHMHSVRALHEYAHKTTTQAGLNLHEVLLSNGTALSAGDVDWLRDEQVKLMISLDGVGNAHDMQRPLRRGGGSFAVVEQTVDGMLLPQGIRPDINITITRLNAAYAAEAVEWALERQLPVSLNFYRQSLNTMSRIDLMLEEQSIIEGVQRAYAVIERILPKYSIFHGLIDRVQAVAHTHTCGVGISYLVITHEGKVAQCHMHLDQAVVSTDQSDALQLVTNGAIHNISVDQKEGCKSCSYRYRCTGGCPIETFRATGRWDVQSPHCNIYKTLIPKALHLEGLRLLKIHGWL